LTSIRTRASSQKPYKIRLIMCGLLTLLFANGLAQLSLLKPEYHDFGNYHLATIRWLTAQPIVPGLGNLHFRLGFNQSYFLYPAQLIAKPLDEHFCCAAN